MCPAEGFFYPLANSVGVNTCLVWMYVFDSLGYLFLEVELPGHVAAPLDLFRTAKLLSEASVPRHTSTCLCINSHGFQRRFHDYQEVRETENFVLFDLAFEAV